MSGQESRRSGRLPFIDGIRGAAALLVMAGHAVGLAVPPVVPGTDVFHAFGVSPVQLLLWPFRFGQQMVWLFIMLSGFALQWSEEERIERGRGRTPPGLYAARRAWRILPTYFVALFVGLAVVVLLRPLLPDPGMHAGLFKVTLAGLLSHLGLLHNLDSTWMYQFNAPLWSIAVEAQLYLLFPLVAAAGRRRVPAAPAAVVITAGAVAFRWITHSPLFDLAYLFFAGVALAHVVRRRRFRVRPLLLVSAGCALVGLTRLSVVPGKAMLAVWMLGLACLLAALTTVPVGGWNLATSKPLLWVGQRSYSLYAIHFPVLLIISVGLAAVGLSGGVLAAAVLALGTPASVGAAHLLYLRVERPSLARMRGPRRMRPLVPAEPTLQQPDPLR